MIGLMPYKLSVGSVAETLEFGEEILRLAEATADEKMLRLAHWASGTTHLLLGNLSAARRALDISITSAELGSDIRGAVIGGAPLEVAAFGYRSIAEFLCGFSDAAVASSNAAQDYAHQDGHSFSIAWAYAIHSRIMCLVGRYDDAIRFGDECVALCREKGYTQRIGHALVNRH